MPRKIFISYRREDSAANAIGIAQYLERTFGRHNVFLDIDMRSGSRFPEELEKRLAECKVLLALIGPGWRDALDGDGRRRLDDPDDWVRLEIGRALQRGVTVIPVKVGGVELPKKAELPDEIRGLLDHQAASVGTTTFRNDMAGLVRDIGAIPSGVSWIRLAAVVVVLAALGAGWFAYLGWPAIPTQLKKMEDKEDARSRDPRWVQLKKEEERQRAEETRLTEATRTRQPAYAAQCDGAEAPVGNERRCLKPGDSFKDCPQCPEMVVVPAGEFMMGSNDGAADEKPVHKVTISRLFAASKFEVTFEQWDACVADRACKQSPEDQNWGRGSRPVINVSWDDISREYLPWLNRQTGKAYRLLSEAEWEYAARAGNQGKYSWGNEIGTNRANCDGCGSPWDNKQAAPVGSFAANVFGLYDMHGNVWEWVTDCYRESYANASSDGTAASDTAGCQRVLRGGSWGVRPQTLRSAKRLKDVSNMRHKYLGFRIARTL